MPTSAAGSEPRPGLRPLRSQRPTGGRRGLTLVEMLVVLALLGVLGLGVSLTLPPVAQRELARDAQRLVHLMETARQQARSRDLPARLEWQEGGFAIHGLTATPQSHRWLSADVRALPSPPLVLGPEPLLPAQRWALEHAQGQRLWLGTDGLQPFAVQGPESR